MIAITTSATDLEVLSHRLMQAWQDRDIDFIKRTISDSFCFIAPSYKGLFFNKEEWMKMVLEIYKVIEFEFKVLKVQYHEGFAIVSSQLVLLVSPSHSGIKQQYIIIDVWKPEEEEWKIVCRQPTFVRQIE